MLPLPSLPGSGIGHRQRIMREVFRASPTGLRHRRHRADRLAAGGGLTLRLPVVPGYGWDATGAFLAARLVPGVGAVEGDTCRRTIAMAGAPGLVLVQPGSGTAGKCRG